MSWFQQGPGTHQLSYSLEKVCCPILLYPMNVRMHIKVTIFPNFWTHLPQLGIPLRFNLYLPFIPVCVQYFCPPPHILDGEFPTPHFWPGISHWWINVFFSSVCARLCLLPPCYFLSLGL